MFETLISNTNIVTGDEAYQGGRYNQRNTNGANTQQGSHAYNRATRNRTNAGETSVSTTFNNTNQNKNQPRARHNDTSNKELLDKFELLGRERRGITPSSYKVQEDNTVDGDWELPSESNILELSQTSNGHSIQEFEEWKAKMREKEGLSRQNNSDNSNNEPRQPGMFDDIMSFNNNDQMNFPSRQQNSNSMDSMYRMEEMLFNQMSSQIAGFSQSSSRFSSFFNGSDNKGGKSSEASPQFENKEPQDADAIAFQRIMSMLNDGQENKQHSPEQQQSTSLNANNMVPENSNDDAFFMSLLNKGGNTESKSPKGASESNNNGQAVAERNNDTRIPSAAQSPVIDVVRQPVRGDPPFQSPHIQAGNLPFPPVPPEWMQKQMPGMPPMPMISNMMPGLPFPPPGMMNGSGNQNSPSNMPPMPPNMMPPPHINGNMPMMPPPPPMMGMPPMPPGMFPMGVPQNGQFPGLPPLPPPGAMGPPMGMSENGQFQGLPPMPLPGSMGPPNPGMNMGGIPPGMSPRISNNERRVRPQ